MKVKKILKITFFVFSAILVLIGIAIVIIPMLFDPNDYKADIQSAVYKSSGRDLSIEGNLSVSVFPWLGIETGKVSLSNRIGFDDHPFAQIEKADVKVKLLPLLSGQIQVDHIVLKGLQLNLTKNDSGVNNWSNFGHLPNNQPKKQPIQIQSADSNISSNETQKFQLASLLVSRLTLEDARIIFNDHSTNRNVEFDNLSFNMEKFRFNDSVDFSVTSTVTTTEPQLSNTVSITGRLIVKDTLDISVIEHLHIQAQTTGNALKNATLDTDITAAAALNLAKNTFTIFKMDLTLEDLVLHSDLLATDINDNPKIKGSVKIDTFNPKSFAHRIGLDLPELKDPNSFTTTNIDFDFSGSTSELQLANIIAQIDQTEIKGAASIAGFDQPLVKFNLDAERLNADKYLPIQATGKGTPANISKPSVQARPSTAAVKDQPANSTPNAIRDLNVEGVLNIRELQFHNIKAQGVRVVAKVKNGIIRTNQSVKSLYNGRYRGAMEFNLQDREPFISVNERFTQLDLKPLLIDFTGKAELAGITDANIQLTARGSDAKAIKASLNGNIELLMTGGYVQGIDILKIIRNTRSIIKQTPSQRGDASDRTKFSDLKVVATVTNGLIHTKKLHVKSQALEADGGGQIYLVNDTVDMKITAKVTNDPAGIAGIKIKELQNVPITINIEGTLSKLSYRPDLKSALKSPEIKKATKKLEKKLEEKLGPNMKNLLDSIF